MIGNFSWNKGEEKPSSPLLSHVGIAIPPKEIMEIAVREHTLLLEQYISRFPKAAWIRHKVVGDKEFVEIINKVLRVHRREGWKHESGGIWVHKI